MTEWSVQDWINASPESRREWQDNIGKQISDAFRVMPRQSGLPSLEAPLLPEFLHIPTNTEWGLVPESTFWMGLSEEEERAARRLQDPLPFDVQEMRPVHQARVGAFLSMKTPVAWSVVQKFMQVGDIDQRPVFGEQIESSPAYLRRHEVDELTTRLGVQLPTESQWECMCRGGTRSLFFFGNDLPSETGVLGSIVGGDISRTCPNPFGFRGLFVGEWCRDRFRRTYDEPGTAEDYVVRGGASVFWPWQDSEWVFCMSAMRMPSSDLVAGLCGARFVLEISGLSL